MALIQEVRGYHPKHGKDYDSNLVDFPDTSLEEYLARLSMAEIKKLEEQSQEDPPLLKNVNNDMERRKRLAKQRIDVWNSWNE